MSPSIVPRAFQADHRNHTAPVPERPALDGSAPADLYGRVFGISAAFEAVMKVSHTVQPAVSAQVWQPPRK